MSFSVISENFLLFWVGVQNFPFLTTWLVIFPAVTVRGPPRGARFFLYFCLCQNQQLDRFLWQSFFSRGGGVSVLLALPPLERQPLLRHLWVSRAQERGRKKASFSGRFGNVFLEGPKRGQKGADCKNKVWPFFGPHFGL